MKHKLSVILIVIVIIIMGIIAGTGETSHLLFPPRLDRSRSDQSDRHFFERNLGKRRIFAVLPDVYRIDVYKLKNNRDWEIYYSGQQPLSQPDFLKVCALTSMENSQILKMLRHSDNFHTEVLQHKNVQNIVIACWTEHDVDAAPFTYVYIPESGRLGNKHDWCQMSNDFQRKMSAIIAH